MKRLVDTEPEFEPVFKKPGISELRPSEFGPPEPSPSDDFDVLQSFQNCGSVVNLDTRLSGVDQNCSSVIAKVFSCIGYLGRGGHSAVLLLAKTGMTSDLFEMLLPGDDFAVKLIPVKQKILGNKLEAVHSDVVIGCELNSLENETKIFTKTYGWTICNGIPWGNLSVLNRFYWPAILNQYIENGGQIMYLFMEHYKYKLEDKEIEFSYDEYILLLFQLIHGLYIARKRIEFAHDDIHLKNILLQPIHPNQSQILFFDSRAVKITGTRFVPKLIDYGYASTKTVQGNSRMTHDISALFGTVLNKMETATSSSQSALIKHIGNWMNESELFRNANNAEQNEFEPLENLLLHDPLFKIPQITFSPLHK